MKKLHLLLLVFFTLQTACYANDIYRGPYLQMGNSNSMTIMWQTVSNSEGVVEYGFTTNYSYSVSSSNSIIHSVELSNLNPSTKYFYKVSCGMENIKSTFITFPADDSPVTFAVVGDTRNSFSNDADYIRVRNSTMSESLSSHDPLFMLNNGDIVFAADPLTNKVWTEMFEDFQTIMKQTPFYFATGNHDLNLYSGEICEGYYDNFKFPTNGPVYKRIYSFDCGNVHITVGEIDNAVTVSNESYYCPGSPQFIWITNDLARTKQPWKIVMTHCPALSSGEEYGTWGYKNEQSTNLLRYYVPEFEKYNVNLHIAGHEHLYERCYKSETTYLTISTWDDSYPYIFTNFPYSIVKRPYGFALCAITNEFMYVSIVDENTNSLVDSFIITNIFIPEPGILWIMIALLARYFVRD